MGSDFSLVSLAEEGRMDFFSPGNRVSFFPLVLFLWGVYLFLDPTAELPQIHG